MASAVLPSTLSELNSSPRLTPPLAERKTPEVVGAGVGDGVMGGSGPTDMDIDNVDMHILPYPDLDAFAFGNLALASLPVFDAKTEGRRSGAMVNFMLDV